jgi:hypothetical protein
MGQSGTDEVGGERFVVLDAWRGIAALMVALYRLEAEGWLHGLGFVRNAYLFVDFFFVLSGFVIAHAYLAPSAPARIGTRETARVFLIRRFGRVWPLHAALLLLIVMLEAARGLHGLARTGAFEAFSGTRAPVTILWDGLLVQALGFTGPTGWNTPAWSISTEFWTYVLFAGLCFGGRRLLLALAPVLVAGGLAVIALRSPTGMDTTFDLGFARCLAGFFSGVLVQDLWRRLRDASLAGPGTGSEVLAIVLAFAFVWCAGRGVMALLAPLVFASLVLVFAFQSGAVSRALSGVVGQTLGRLSYSIYMTALLVSLVFNKAAIAMLGRLGAGGVHEDIRGGYPHLVYDLGPALANDAYALIYLCCVLAVSAVTYRFIEQPARGWFNRLADRQPASPSAPATQLSLKP